MSSPNQQDKVPMPMSLKNGAPTGSLEKDGQDLLTRAGTTKELQIGDKSRQGKEGKLGKKSDWKTQNLECIGKSIKRGERN